MIKKVLIANRGEIALRVMRSCREMGLLTVAVFSDADRTSHHVAYADEAYPIGSAVAKESYLNIEKVIATAKRCGADAIHPGYGFLSENSEFARRCKEEGIIFIGPAAETMEAMGDKIAARKRMIAAGVPVVPGTERTFAECRRSRAYLQRDSYPVMLKASMGGGGKGMRLIHNESEVVEATTRHAPSPCPPLETTRSIWRSSWKNRITSSSRYWATTTATLSTFRPRMLRATPQPEGGRRKPVTLPYAGIAPGNGREGGCRSKGSELLRCRYHRVSGRQEPPFLFPRNEYAPASGAPHHGRGGSVDLVKEQIRIANDEVLHLKQEDLFQRGHAIECRICAEDTENNFMPSPGVIKQLTEPNGIGVRIDSYVYDGYEIPIYYDPMIGKLIVWATTRQYAIERMRRVLYEYKITGVKTNLAYLKRIMHVPDFVKESTTPSLSRRTPHAGTHQHCQTKSWRT